MRVFWLILGLLACSSHAWAQREVLRVQQGSVEVQVSSPFAELPPMGYVPLSVRVTNGSRAPFEHSCVTVSSGNRYGGSRGADTFMQNVPISIPAGEARTMQLVAPVGNVGQGGYGGTTLSLTLTGSGFMSGSRSGEGPYIVATENALGARISQIQTTLRSGGRGMTVNMVSLTPDLISEDSRAWFGVEELWITPTEWRQLRPGQLLALRDSVTRGMRIVLWGKEVDRGIIDELVKLGGTATEANPNEAQVGLGFGEVALVGVPGDLEAMVKKAVEYLQGETSFKLEPVDQKKAAVLSRAYRDWGLYELLPKLKVNLPLTILFIVAFTIVVGPVNLFVFSKANNRYRMFWITPLLSVGASLLLWLLIVVVDGFGAMGNRSLLVYVNGTENRASFFQEQAVRAGVLTNRSFSIPGPVAVQPLTFSYEPKGETYRNNNGVYDGGWFTSRAISGLFLESSDAFRGEVEIVNREAFEKNGNVAPEVISSLPAPLKILEVVDARGNVWRGRDLKTGQRHTLERASDNGLLVKKEAIDSMGAINKAHVNRLTGRKKMFYAWTQEGGTFLETLPGIRWENQSTIFVGNLD